MPKDWTPKAIANAAKAKGLQKLRFYCQMCHKQCRDENGFKCHQTSEAHLRQMRLFAEDAGNIMQRFSDEFEQIFVQSLARQHGTKRTKANDVYREVIADRHHVHMNSTHWATLTDFVLYLGKKGVVLVEDDPENGLHVQWIDRNPEKLAREARWRAKEAAQLNDAQVQARDVRRRQEAMRALAGETEEERSSAVLPREGDAVRIEMGGRGPRRGVKRPLASVLGGDVEGEADEAKTPAPARPTPAKTKARAIDQLIQRSLDEREAADRAERRRAEAAEAKAAAAAAPPESATGATAAAAVPWLMRGITVKIRDRDVGGGAFHKKKGRVSSVEDDGFVALVKVDTEEGRTVKLRIDATMLETVVPKVNHAVLVLPNASRVEARGCRGTLRAIHAERFCVSVRMEEGALAGHDVDDLEYEMVSRPGKR